MEMNLIANEDKIEHKTVKRGTKEEECKWRNILKLGSKFGNREGIERDRRVKNSNNLEKRNPIAQW